VKQSPVCQDGKLGDELAEMVGDGMMAISNNQARGQG
jgi:hypothetical protein